MADAPDAYDRAVMSRLGGFRRTASSEEPPEVAEMRRNRAVMRRSASSAASQRGGANLSFATGRPRDPMFYWKQNNLPYDLYDHDELKKVRAYCNTPDAPVWMGDYSFRPIGEIQPGDEVMGWIYRTGPLGDQRKVLTRTTVLGTQRRMAPEVVKVTMESGEVIRCTPDHLWANPHFSTYVGPSGWQQPEYRAAKVGQDLIRVVRPTEPLADEKLRLAAAWLGGVYDGEGTGERIAQDEAYSPAVRERIKHSLDLLGLSWTESRHTINISKAGRKGGAGAHQDLVDFLNWADPVRRTSAAIDKRLLCRPSAGRERIVSIESEGPGEVVSMQTGTGNYTAWGLASKNCRLLYQSHPLIGSCVDIYTKYPLLGMEMSCKDEKLTDFYSDHFLGEDEGLNYGKFLIDFGREYWTVGEAVPFGSFNESLGVWDDEELLNPDDLEVVRSPFLKDPRFFIKLPETLREIITKRTPAWEYEKLMQAYPELSHYAAEDALMPVSSVLLRHYKFEADTFNKRGVPLLMRAMRPIMQEEMLNAAMDAVADRLYTPLILARLGASASDLGTTTPWIPNDGDLADFEEALDGALSADFRVLVHHFGVTMESVFGRENMPDMTPDFERLEDRMLQTFGLSKTMLTGASAGQTYAADALNRDLVSQLLTTYQNIVKRHYRQRAMVVAEAQEHYDYDERNGKRYVKMEEILEIDEDGQEHIVEQPKLLIPDLHMKTMSLKDEEAERAFFEQLRAAGVPISMKTRLQNVPIDFADEIEQSMEEQVDLAVREQETRKEIFLALRAKGLPIPADLTADFQPMASNVPGPASQGMRVPMMGIDPVMGTPTLAPVAGDLAAPTAGGVVAPGMPTGPVDPFQPGGSGQVLPFPSGGGGAEGDTRPEESDEMRKDMPKASSLEPANLYRAASRMREITREHYQAPAPITGMTKVARTVTDEDGATSEKEVEVPDDGGIARGGYAAPKHIGMRRHAGVTATTLLDTLEEDPDAERPA